jgi:hypothetical protein
MIWIILVVLIWLMLYKRQQDKDHEDEMTKRRAKHREEIGEVEYQKRLRRMVFGKDRMAKYDQMAQKHYNKPYDELTDTEEKLVEFWVSELNTCPLCHEHHRNCKCTYDDYLSNPDPL